MSGTTTFLRRIDVLSSPHPLLVTFRRATLFAATMLSACSAATPVNTDEESAEAELRSPCELGSTNCAALTLLGAVDYGVDPPSRTRQDVRLAPVPPGREATPRLLKQKTSRAFTRPSNVTLSLRAFEVDDVLLFEVLDAATGELLAAASAGFLAGSQLELGGKPVARLGPERLDFAAGQIDLADVLPTGTAIRLRVSAFDHGGGARVSAVVGDARAAPFVTPPGFLPPGAVSSPFADPTRAYVPRRPIELLERLGALDTVERTVLRRVDGILANSPADGFISIEELERAEQSDKWPAFLSDEQARFPALWARMVAPSSNATVVAPPVWPEPVDETILPGPLLTSPAAISTFPAELRTTADRLERLHDEDGDDTTVALADVDAALATPAPFTSAEIGDLEKIRALIRARGTTTGGRAAVRVADPGTTVRELLRHQNIAIRTRDTIAYAGSRRVDFPHNFQHYSGQLTTIGVPIITRIARELTRKIEYSVPAGTTLVTVMPDGKHCDYPAAGDVPMFTFFCTTDAPVAVELWRDGKPVEGAFARLGALASWISTRDLSAYAGYEFLLPDGTALVESVTRTIPAFSQGAIPLGAEAQLVYERTARPGSSVDASVVTAVALPALNLPPGRYRRELDDGNDVFEADVLPGGVIYGGLNGARDRLTPIYDPYGTKAWSRVSAKSPGSAIYPVDRPTLWPNGQLALPAMIVTLEASDRQ